MITNEQLWWHLSRASGIVAWFLLSLGVLWGLLLSTRLLRHIDRPAWLLDLHKWLGTLTWAVTGIHLVTLVADSYVHFSLVDLFVPFASHWKPAPVAWGIIAFYLIVVVQVTSRWMKRLPRALWHAVHLASYPAFALVAVHAFSAGSDASNHYFIALGVALITVVAVVTLVRVSMQTGARSRQNAAERAA